VFVLGRVHVISTGPISCLSRQSGVLQPHKIIRREWKLLQALTSALLDTDRSHKTAIYC
ncbi:unnamed protein product, partial [Staurois parvus]